jgi:uncharacterized membrane protein YidH (DUF202 family)
MRHPLWDPGAQPERTYQAWTRTGLALVACTLLATRLAPEAGAVALAVSVAGAAAAFAVVHRQKLRLHSQHVAAAPGSVLALTALVISLACMAVALALSR